MKPVIDIVVGGSFGDEGKGKILDYLSNVDYPDAVVKCGCGPNAGHSVYRSGEKFGLNQIPSAVLNPLIPLYISSGVLIDPTKFLEEKTKLEKILGREIPIEIDFRCGIITKEHIARDAESSTNQKIGTTKTGCGPAMSDRVNRIGPRAKDIKELESFLTDVTQECLKKRLILLEASQGFGLSLLHGTYPYVTSKDTTASTALADIGFGPKYARKIYLVVKSYTTRVGSGPMPVEMSHEEAVKLGWDEYGTVTGRARRVSKYLDIDMIKSAIRANSATDLVLTKLDARFPEIQGMNNLKDLIRKNKEAYLFYKDLEEQVGCKVSLIGTGKNLEEIVDLRQHD